MFDKKEIKSLSSYYMVPIIIKRVIFILFAFLLTGCPSAPEVVENPEDAREEQVIDEVASEEAPEQDEAVEQAPEQPDKEEDFVVTEEVFVETFQAVEEVIGELNALIRAGQYDRWIGYLTEEYINTFSDPDLLAELSQSDRLQANGIVLEDLQDFFTEVVVPSRANLRLDDLVFIDEDQVEAIMVIRDQRISVYRLRLIDNEWKIEG